MRDERPYLSVVVTTRNDNHGGDLLRRTQIFIDALAAQANAHEVDTELVIVEWNPPEGRPPLADALRWPEGGAHFEARIVTVPKLLHGTLDNSARLPLFQMIAKNVGIRRARGRFILATNIDLLFSNDLMAFLAQESLEHGRLYRVDRWDVAAEVPMDVPVNDQLAWSERNIVRICRRVGTFDVRTGDFHRIYESIRVPLWVAPWLRLGRYLERSGRRLVWRVCHLPVHFARIAVRIAFAPRSAYRAWLRRSTRKVDRRSKRRRMLNIRLDVGLIGRALANRVASLRLLVVDERARMRLHTNACGDFTLMSHEAWTSSGGYPELEIFSMHIDSLMLYQAHYAGITEYFLPYRVYHIEHEDGFKPDKRSLDKLNTRLERAAIPQISNKDFLEAIVEMYRSKQPKFSNLPTWGFLNSELPETVVVSSTDRSRRETELVV